MEGNKEYYSLNDIIKFFKSFFRYLRRKWWVLVLAVFIGAITGFIYYRFFQRPKYEAVCTFILEEKQSGIGGLGGLATQFGLDVGSLSGGGSVFAGDNILDILKAKSIIRNVLLSKVDSAGAPNNETLADLFLDFSGWKKAWSNEEDLKDINFKNYRSIAPLSIKQDSVLNLIHVYLLKSSLTTERLNKKGSIIKLVVTSPHPYFAKLMSDRVINESSTFYVTIKTNTAQQNVNRLERKSDSLLALLNNKSYEAAGAVVLDANPALKRLNVSSELKTRDKTILGTLYSEMVKNLELSRVSLSQQTPVIQILDRPTLPLVNKKKSLLLLMFLSAFVCFLLTGVAIFLKFLGMSVKPMVE